MCTNQKHVTHKLFVSAAGALLLTLHGISAWASTALAMDLAELTKTADEIVVATVISMQGEPSRGRINTRVIVRVQDVIVGNVHPSDELEIIIPGGEFNGIGMLVHGAPRLVMGDRQLLFLKRHDFEFHVVGLAQGALPVQASTVNNSQSWLVGPQNHLPGLVRVRDGQLESAAPAVEQSVQLEEIIARIREVRRGGL